MTVKRENDTAEVRNPLRDRALIAYGRGLGRKEIRDIVGAELRIEDQGEACCGHDNSIDLALRLRAAIAPAE